jgi:phospholipid/cholesterol/gamma-HCH transport system substrate-binding protein
METKANYTLIGLFTLAVIAATFGFVHWFQHLGGGSDRAYYRIVFQSSVSGLRTGSAVLFNGIRVGEVTTLTLRPDQPQQVVALVSIDPSVKVRPDTRAGVEFQGFTGIAAVALAGGSPGEPPLSGLQSSPGTLVASPASTQDVTQGAREVLQRIDDFIEENRAAFRSTLQNIDTFSAALAHNSQRIDGILAGVESFTGNGENKGELSAATQSIRELAEKLSNLADNLDKRTETITRGINGFTATGSKQIEVISRDVQRTLSTIDRTVNNIDKNPSRLLFGGDKR